LTREMTFSIPRQLVEQIAGRIGRALERRGLVERDLENAWLAADTEAGPLDDLLGHSITYRNRGRTAGGAEALYAADGCASTAGTGS